MIRLLPHGVSRVVVLPASEYIFLGVRTSATSEYLLEDIAEVLEQTGCFARLYVVPIGTYQREISAIVPPERVLSCTADLCLKLLRLLRVKKAQKHWSQAKAWDQVASQTMDNMLVTNAAVSLPVYRPLVGFDKLEIIAEAEKLGTFEISSQDAPDCCTLFMPRNPETHAKLERVLEVEKGLPFDEWINEAVASVEVKDYRCPSYRPPKERKKQDAKKTE